MNIAVWILEGDNKMKTLVNKDNPAIRMTAPEIEIHEEEDMYFIPVSDYCIPMCIDDWTLVEEEETIVKTIKEFAEKGKRCEQQAVEEQDYGNYVFWGGFRNCAENLLREVEKPTEGIKGNLEEIPSNVDLEKEAVAFCFDNGINVTPYQATIIARHFYELGRIAQIEQNKALADMHKLPKEKEE